VGAKVGLDPGDMLLGTRDFPLDAFRTLREDIRGVGVVGVLGEDGGVAGLEGGEVAAESAELVTPATAAEGVGSAALGWGLLAVAASLLGEGIGGSK